MLKMGLRSFIKNRVVNRNKKDQEKKDDQIWIKESFQKQHPQGVSSKTKEQKQDINLHPSSLHHSSTRAASTIAVTSLSKFSPIESTNEEEEPVGSKSERIRSGKLTEEEKEAFVRRALGIKDATVVNKDRPTQFKMRKPRIRNPMFEELIAGQTKDELISDLENQKLEYVKMITNPHRFSNRRKTPRANQIENSPLPSPSRATREEISPSKMARGGTDNDLGARLQAEAMVREKLQQELRKQAEEERLTELRLKAEAERRRMEAIAEHEYKAQLRRQKLEEEEAYKEEIRRQIEARKQAEILARQEDYWNNKVRMERESRMKELEEKKKESSKSKVHYNNNQLKTQRKNGRSKITRNLSSRMSIGTVAKGSENFAQKDAQLAEIERAKKEQAKKLKTLYSQTEIQQRNEEEQELRRIKEEQAVVKAKERQRVEEQEQAAIETAEEQRRLHEEEQAAIKAEEQRRLSEKNQRKAKIDARKRRAKEKEELRQMKAREQAEKMAAQEEYWKNKVKEDRESRVKVTSKNWSQMKDLNEEKKVESQKTDASISAHQKVTYTNASSSFLERQRKKLGTTNREKAKKIENLKSLNSPLPSIKRKINMSVPSSATSRHTSKKNERSVNFRTLMRKRSEEDANQSLSTVVPSQSIDQIKDLEINPPAQLLKKVNLRNLMNQRKEDDAESIDNELGNGNSQPEDASSLEIDEVQSPVPRKISLRNILSQQNTIDSDRESVPTNDLNIENTPYPTTQDVEEKSKVISEVKSRAPKRISLRNILSQQAALDSKDKNIPQNDYRQSNMSEISAPKKASLREILRKQAERLL